MNDTNVVVTLKKNNSLSKIEGTRVTFSPYQCFKFNGDKDDIACIKTLATHLKSLKNITLLGSKKFISYLLQHDAELDSHILAKIYYDDSEASQRHALASISIPALPAQTENVFLCETLKFPRMQIINQIPASINVIEPTILAEIAPEVIPARGWAPMQQNIYPIEIPEIKFDKNLDFAIVDCPSRNLSLMPNGLGYLNNALKKTNVNYQILDLDIISYHRYHIHRIYDMGGSITLPGELKLPEDPWQAEHYDLWTTSGGGASGPTGRNEVLEFFRPVLDEAIKAIVDAQPKVLGLSIQGCNEAASHEVAKAVKEQLPEIIIVVGGFSCYNPDIGRRAFPECDYMCIGESDLTVGPLLEALARGERPKNQPGVLSKFDTPDYRYIPAPMIHNLDQIEFPKYEWADLSLYRNFNDYQLTPIIASRGCRWSRCTFCAERFYWRIRTPENFADELEWLVNNGCYLYMFNESDLGGMPERVMEICDEIIRRGLHRKVKLTGQLRVNKKQNRAFFEKLREANFVALRFGIDAFSENTLRLQKKGYTVDMISQNLRDCWEVGIFTEVNWVIGVPGETDDDVTEGIELVLKNRQYIGRLANINPLILVNGSVYWIDPDAHNIVFKEPKDVMYEKYPRALPADQWHSTNPYIDAQVRKARFERIVISLHDAGFSVGAWANRIIEDVKFSRDRARTGASDEDDKSFGEFEVAGGSERKAARDKSMDSIDIKKNPKLTSADLIETNDDELESKPKEIANVIAIHGDGKKNQSKPLAEPPLFGEAGEPPRLIITMETHKVVFYNGWYFGIPLAMNDVDLTNPDVAGMSGILRDTSEAELIAKIEESVRWADTRGQYDDQKKQRAGGTYMRVNSIGEATEENILPEKPKVFIYGDSYIAVNQQTLKNAFKKSRVKDRTSNQSIKIHGGTFMRRLANKLPSSFLYEIRQLLKNQSLTDGTYSTPLVTKKDNQLALMVIKAAYNRYIKGPFLSSSDSNKSGQSHVTNVAGEDFAIVSVITSNAQPELMWSLNEYNLVKFDGRYYGVPHGAAVDWSDGNIADIPGMLICDSAKEIVTLVEQNSTSKTEHIAAPTQKAQLHTEEFSSEPVLLATMADEGYNIVSYEGWIYGMPLELGSLDLTEVDVMEMPGVIRDVSQDAVENEIIETTSAKRQAVQ